MKAYTVGVDFGSLSARAVLMDLETGDLTAAASFHYPHGIMTRELPNGTRLGQDWALQHPMDYWDALCSLIPRLLNECKIRPEQVKALGLDVTSCTVVPTDEAGTPLCCLEEYAGEPNAWVKLWKHHAAQRYTARMDALASEMKQPWLARCGGKVSSEHYLPKVLQIADESPAVYDAAFRILEMGDWLTWRLCGVETRNYCAASYKTFYQPGVGDVSPLYLRRLNPRLENLAGKLPPALCKPGDLAGHLTQAAAEQLGLTTQTAVAVAGVDAHVTMLGCHIHEPGKLLMIIGTSSCHMLLSPVYREISGFYGVVPDGILTGWNAYEAGQSCVGDLFAWFLENCVPASYEARAKAEGKSLHQLMTELASKLRPGENGLIALDWWNGVRSTLLDFNLSGLMVGMTLQTKPEEIYRALLEATAYGTKRILHALESNQVGVDTLYAAGGIPMKNPLMMQIYADVTGRDVHVIDWPETGALGSAILAAASLHQDGARHLTELLQRYQRPFRTVYHPDPESAAVYRQLYEIYSTLYRQFGLQLDCMKKLKSMQP